MKMTGLLFIFIVFLFLGGQPAFAHQLQTEGSIGAILHIDPDDAPLAGSPSTVFFEIKDTQNQFATAQCICRMVINEQGNDLATVPLLSQSPTTLAATYTFPQRDVYTLKLLGTPKTAGSFASFTLDYTVRVATGNTAKQSFFQAYWQYVVAWTVLGLLALYFLWSEWKGER